MQRAVRTPTGDRVIAIICLILLVASPLAPATIVVEGPCTLAEAITAANTDIATGGCTAGSGEDTIDLKADVTLTAADHTDSSGPTGLPAITTAVTVQGNGHTLARANTAPPFRLLHITPSGSATIDSLTITQGRMNSYLTAGGILNKGTLVLRNSTVSNNQLVGSAITTIGALGGGIYSSGPLTLENSTVSGNSVTHPYLALGGGIGFFGSNGLSISSSIVSGNSAVQSSPSSGFDASTSLYRGGHGGGLMTVSSLGTPVIIDTTFVDNSASGVVARGGAIRHHLSPVTLSITRSVLVNNTVSATGSSGPFGAPAAGGGLFGGPLTINNSTFSGNSAIHPSTLSSGGAIYSKPPNGATSTIANTTFSGNSASFTGGLHHEAPGTEALYLANTVFANSTGQTQVAHCVDGNFFVMDPVSLIDLGNNQADSADCFASGAAIPATLTGLSATLADNGGPTMTHALETGSSAIDAAGICGLPTDQRGFVRLDGACDAGAFEFNGCEDDSFEDDDVCSGPQFGTLGVAESHKHCDEDWTYFRPIEGATYEIETSSLAGGADTVLELYRECGPLLAQDDNSGIGLASQILYTALPRDNVLDLRIFEQGDSYTTGEAYDLTITCVANCTCDASGGNNLFLQDATISSKETFEACVSITTGPDWGTKPPAVVNLIAGSVVRLGNGTSLDGTVTIEIKPALKATENNLWASEREGQRLAATPHGNR